MVHRTVGSVCYASVVCLAMATSLGACQQNVAGLSEGASETDIRAVLGAPTEIESARKRTPDDLARLFPECAPEKVAAVAELWTYDRHLRKSVLLALRTDKTLLCVHHGGVTFVQ